MPNESIQDIENNQFFAMISYLSQGGTLAKANNISPCSLEATYNMAYHQYTSGHYEEAAKAFQYLCIYDQWNPRNFICLGACLQMMQLYGQAFKTYLFALKLERTNPLPLIYMADCELALNRVESSIKIYKTAIGIAKELDFNHKEVSRAEITLTSIDASTREKQ